MAKKDLRNGITQSAEDYLKAIFKLQRAGARVTTNDIAKTLRVSAASVTNMVKKLAAARLLRHTNYQGVELTKSGEKVALEVIRHHRLLELYLLEAMGYSWDQVHDEAEKLEHHISEEFEEKMDRLLGHRKRDPHGDPIPSKDLTIEELNDSQMSDMQVGQRAVISRVSDENPEMLRYLSQLGMVPEAAIELLKKEPFKGPMCFRVGRKHQSVGHELARTIYVSNVD